MPKPKTKIAAPVKKAGSVRGKPRATRRLRYPADEVREIFRRFSVQRPEPRGELEYENPFTLLVAVVLSAQATDVSVNKATEGLFRVADTPRKMAALGEDKIGSYIKAIGLWRGKAKNVLALSQALIRDHGGKVPEDHAALTKLPGVGRKTANVVLNTAFGHHTLAVDTHIFRIGNRLDIAPGKTPDEVEKAFLKIIPPEYLRHAHHWLILHGRYVCKARRPECERCVIADLCKSPEKTSDVPAPLVPIEPLRAEAAVQ
jgi:endonuclease III